MFINNPTLFIRAQLVVIKCLKPTTAVGMCVLEEKTLNAGSFQSAISAYAGCIHESLAHGTSNLSLLGIIDTNTFENASESAKSHSCYWFSGDFVIVCNDYQFEGHWAASLHFGTETEKQIKAPDENLIVEMAL